MKSLPTIISIMLLMISSQAFAWETYKPYNPFQAGMNGNMMVPYQPLVSTYKPQPYKDPMADFRKQQQMQAIADQSRAYRAMETEALNRMGAAHACSFITGNDTARRQCYSEIK